MVFLARGRSGAAAAASALEGRREKMKGPGVSSPSPSEVLREGELEKRSEGLFQLWKKKQVVLRKASLSLCSAEAGKGRAKELPFDAVQKVDCVERTGKYVYFTLVTTDGREIDFRCPGESCWNASITLALIAFQNQRAVQDFKSRQEAAEPGTPTGREPTGGGGGGEPR